MQVQRASLDQLRLVNLPEKVDSLIDAVKRSIEHCEEFLREKGDGLRQKPPLHDHALTLAYSNFEEHINYCKSLEKDFINEIRHNSYEITEGVIRMTFAVDCSNLIKEWDGCKRTLLDVLKSIKGTENESFYDWITDLLFKAWQMISTNKINNTLNDYFSNFWPSKLEYSKQKNEADSSNEIKTAQKQLPPELNTASKKTRKEKNISLKQQMILLDTLGFLKADVWGQVNTKDKAFILSHLLNRTEQEVRGMLTYWEGTKRHPDYDCTGADDNDVITDMVLGKALKV